MTGIRRREFITLVTSAAAWPLAAGAIPETFLARADEVIE
jgi:hypothetical protein